MGIFTRFLYHCKCVSKLEWSLYIVETEDGSLYTGITKDLERRFQEHQDGTKGAKFFRTSPAARMRFSISRLLHGDALRLEAAVKKLPRAKKEVLDKIEARKILRKLKTVRTTVKTKKKETTT